MTENTLQWLPEWKTQTIVTKSRTEFNDEINQRCENPYKY